MHENKTDFLVVVIIGPVHVKGGQVHVKGEQLLSSYVLPRAPLKFHCIIANYDSLL